MCVVCVVVVFIYIQLALLSQSSPPAFGSFIFPLFSSPKIFQNLVFLSR